MASQVTVRYPSEFTADPGTDFISIKMIRRDYNSTAQNVYQLVDPPSDSCNVVYLNVPQKVTESFAQNWANSSLGEAGRFAGNRGGAPANFLVNAAKRLIENSLLQNVTENFKKIGASQINENSILSASSGIVYNPYMEVLYDGPEFRRFNFQFSLFTKSNKDAQAIFKIVKFFKYSSVPSLNNVEISNLAIANTILDSANVDVATTIGQGVIDILKNILTPGGNRNSNRPNAQQSPIPNTVVDSIIKTGVNVIGGGAAVGGAIFSGDERFIKQPPFLLLEYRRGSNKHPFINSLLPCAVTGLDIDYTPTGNYTVIDNFNEQKVATVVGVNITVQLTELKNVFSNNIETNFGGVAPGVQ